MSLPKNNLKQYRMKHEQSKKIKTLQSSFSTRTFTPTSFNKLQKTTKIRTKQTINEFNYSFHSHSFKSQQTTKQLRVSKPSPSQFQKTGQIAPPNYARNIPIFNKHAYLKDNTPTVIKRVLAHFDKEQKQSKQASAKPSIGACSALTISKTEQKPFKGILMQDIDIDDLQSRQSYFILNKSDCNIPPRNSKQFIAGLDHNELFFCCQCFHYVFPVEKHRHYPSCQDATLLDNIPNELKHNYALDLLQRIVDLAQYSQTCAEDVKQMHKKLILHQITQGKNIQTFTYPPDLQYMTLDQIRVAYQFTFDRCYNKYPDLNVYYCF